jgi:hypothetical protein
MNKTLLLACAAILCLIFSTAPLAGDPPIYGCVDHDSSSWCVVGWNGSNYWCYDTNTTLQGAPPTSGAFWNGPADCEEVIPE